MKTAISKDGTRIAYDVYGEGKPVIMVGGTMNSRIFGPAPGALMLGENFAVYDYDRRGRGDSGDNQPYSPDKEIEDIAALIEAAGGQAAICGFSAGAALALRAAITLGPDQIRKLAMYEGPYTRDSHALKEWKDYGEILHNAVESGNPDDLVMAFIKLVHAEDQVEKLRKDKPTWQKLSNLAPTLQYDYEIIGPTKRIPKEEMSKVSIPTLVVCGGESGPNVAEDTEYIAKLIPQGASRVIPGQAHNVDPGAIAPLLKNFFA